MSSAMEIRISSPNLVSYSSRHTWVIEKFDGKMLGTPPGGYLQSQPFGRPTEQPKWLIRLYPNGSAVGDPGKVSVYLCLQGPTDTKVEKKVVFKLSYLDPSGTETYGFFQTKTFVKEAGSNEHSWGFWTSHANLLQYGVMQLNGSTIITCTIHEMEESKNSEISSVTALDDSIKSGLEKLYSSKQLADCTVRADGVNFPAHKAILGAHSDAIRATFTSFMQECHTDTIEISDATGSSVSALLDFVYMRKLPSTEEGLADLLVLADRFLLAELKDLCQHRLESHLEATNVLHRYVLAYLHDASNLRLSCSRFCRQKWSQLVKQPDWQDFRTLQPRLYTALLEDIMTEIHKEVDLSNSHTL